MAILPPGGGKKNTIKAHSDVHRVFAGSGLLQEAGLGLSVWYLICTTPLENIQYATSNSIKKDSNDNKKMPKTDKKIAVKTNKHQLYAVL